ncbi:hypothetical protein ACIBO1_13810 [Micromonospora sp. NPDC049903]|uniref:hypothetical protein n=1 Tax=Micromonospora sp. NPDC049903 TaxID=3364276 RepID=UPI0037977D8A
MRSEVVFRLGAALTERGWRWWDDINHETPSLVLSSSNGMVYSVGLVSQTMSERRVAFSPTLGVTHVEVSRLAAAFNGRPWRGAGDSSSLGVALSNLLHSAGFPASPYSRWMVNSESEVEHVSSVILEDLELHGSDFWNGFLGLDDMISWMRGDKGYQALVGNLAIALALRGADEEAVVALREYAAFATGLPEKMRDRTRVFLVSFSEHFELGSNVCVA